MKLLMATDGSKYSEISAKFIKALNFNGDSQVVITTVVEEYVPISFSDVYPNILASIEEIHKGAFDLTGKILDKAERLLEGVSKQVVKKAYVGHPAEEIIKASEEFGVDLIITGSSGRTGLEELLLGGVSQKVLKYSTKPVLIVKKSFKKLDKILFATDGSKYSHKALDWIINNKLPQAAKVSVLSVVPDIEGVLLQESMVLRERFDTVIKAHKEAASLIVENAKKDLKKYFPKVHTEVLEGDPANEILIAAKQGKYDLIVMGAKGLSSVEAFMLGGTTRKVAKLSGASVLVVR